MDDTAAYYFTSCFPPRSDAILLAIVLQKLLIKDIIVLHKLGTAVIKQVFLTEVVLENEKDIVRVMHPLSV